MPLHCEAPLRSTSPFRSTTYTRTGGFCPGANPEFQRMARQNPPVLWLTESVCSCPEQPLSATYGRQRYNTLDFASKVVCHETAGFIGFFLPRQLCRLWKPLPRERCPLWNSQPTGCTRPYWKPRAKGKSHPFGIPTRFEMSTHKWKKVCGHSFQNAKIPQAILQHEEESLWDSLCRTHRRIREIRALCTAAPLRRCMDRNTHPCSGERRHDDVSA